MKKQIFLRILGIFMLFGTFLVLLLTFYTAYFHETKSVMVYIDEMGEADIEAWLFMPAVFIFGLISLILVTKDCSEEMKKNQRRENPPEAPQSQKKAWVIIFITIFTVFLGINLVSGWSNNTFNNSLTFENLTFIGNENITRYLEVPEGISVTNAYLNLSGYNNSEGAYDDCYQESANVSTACGGYANGTYFVVGTWADTTANITDEDWGTMAFREGVGTDYLYVNYSKPAGMGYALWQLGYQNATANVTNVTIPSDCFDAFSDLLQLRIDSVQEATDLYILANCHNGSEFTEIFNTIDVGCEFYEEAVTWLAENSSIENPSISIENVDVWNFTGEFNQTNNRTSNLASTINEHLNSTYLIGTTYVIPFIFHSDTIGILQYLDLLFSDELTENSQTFNATTFELAEESFELNITYGSGDWTDISANLIYNETSYLGTATGGGNNILFSSIVDIPTYPNIPATIPFYWRIALTNASGTSYYNSTFNNQTVNEIVFAACNTTYTSPILVNFSVYNETDRASINATMDATFSYYVGGGGQFKNYTFDSASNETFQFCGNSNETYTVNAIINLEADGFNERSYYFNLESYDNDSTTETKLFMQDDGSNIIIQVRDAGLSPVEDYYVDIDRFYPETNEYETVIKEQTDIYGQFVARLTENDVKYKFTFRNSSNYVMKTTGDMTIACRATICVLPFVIEDTEDDVERFGNLTDYDWSFAFDDVTNIFTFTWNDVSGVSATMRLEVERYLWNGTTTVCNTTSITASGSLTCDVGSGSASYQAQAFRQISGQLERRIAQLSEKVGEEYETFGREGLLWAFILLMTMIVIGYWNPPIGIGLFLVGVIILSIINVVYIDPAILIAFFAIGIAFIWAFRKGRS